MRKLLFKLSDANIFDAHSDLKVIDQGFALDSYNACIIELNGKHGPVRSKVSDETLYILEGEISVQMEDEVFIAQKGDFIVMPAGKWRTETGKAKALAICNPPYNPEDEEYKD